MEKMTEIVKLLEQQVINKTLSLDGIAQVQEIINSNKKLEFDLKRSKESYEDCQKSLKEANDTIINIKSRLTVLEEANAKFLEQEETFKTNVIEARYLQLRADEMKEIVGMALRNPVITKTRESSIFTNSDKQEHYVQKESETKNETATETVIKEVK